MEVLQSKAIYECCAGPWTREWTTASIERSILLPSRAFGCDVESVAMLCYNTCNTRVSHSVRSCLFSCILRQVAESCYGRRVLVTHLWVVVCFRLSTSSTSVMSVKKAQQGSIVESRYCLRWDIETEVQDRGSTLAQIVETWRHQGCIPSCSLRHQDHTCTY